MKKHSKKLLCISSALVAFGLYQATTSTFAPRSDLTAYLTAAEIIKDGEAAHLYDLETQRAYQHRMVPQSTWMLPFRNPPLLAVPFVPLSYLPLSAAYRVMMLLSLLAVLAVACSHATGRHLGLLLFLSLASFPTGFAVILGQIVPFVLLLLISIHADLKNGKWFSAGLKSSLFLLKPHFGTVLVLFWLIAGDRKSYFTGAFVGGVALALGTVGLTGVAPLLAYPQFALLTEQPEFQFGSHATEWYSLAAMIGFWPAVALLPFGILAFSFTTNWSLERRFSLAVLVACIFAVHTTPADLMFTLVPLGFIANRYGQASPWERAWFFSMIVMPLLPFAAAWLIGLTLAYAALGFRAQQKGG